MEEQISKRYATCEVNDKRCFVTSKGIVFSIFEFPSEDALCIEYADSQLEAKRNAFEDGDRFYLEDMDAKEMLQKILTEIES
ncbi:MAG: hypothetical protein RR297_01020 [Clostridia bacterium]